MADQADTFWGRVRRALVGERPALPAPIAVVPSKRYAGAQLGGMYSDFRPQSRGPLVSSQDLVTLRARARELVRDNPHAKRAIRRLADRLVGRGIVPRFKSGDPELDRTIKAAWRKWVKQASTSDNKTWYGLQWMSARAMVESGEVFMRRRDRRIGDPSAGMPLDVPLQIQVLEADFCPAWMLSTTAFGQIIQGIEFDLLDRPIAYHLHKQHPLASWNVTQPGAQLITVRVPAESVCHLRSVDERPGQTRGVPWLSAVLLTMRDLGDLDAAELLRQKLASAVVAFAEGEEQLQVGSQEPEEGDLQETDQEGYIRVVNEDGDPIETFAPGMIARVYGANKVTFNSPPNPPSAQEFRAAQLAAAAAAVGLTYEDVSNDTSRSNYSSHKAGRLATDALIENEQAHSLIPILDQQLRWWLDAAQLAGIVPATATVEVEWITPAREEIDREKAAAADRAEIRSGLDSWANIVHARGMDPDELLEKLQSERAAWSAAGLVLDSDGNTTTQAGQIQPQSSQPT